MNSLTINTIKTALSTAGCSLVIYENDQLANVRLDESGPNDYTGVLLESNSAVINPTGGAVRISHPLTVVEILHQVDPENSAENNQLYLDQCMTIAGLFVGALVGTGLFKRIANVTASKITERKYDANLLGWSLAINLQLIDNTIPCE
jgi:hypothetical protein